MKKIALVVITLFVASICSCYAVQKVKVTPQVNSGISMYKQQNYTGSVQALKSAVDKNPNDVLARYYLAISYVQLGMRKEATDAFDEVVKRDKEIGGLAKLSQQALDCYADETKCASKKDDMGAFIKSGDFLYKDAKQKIQGAQLKQIMDTINSGEKNLDFTNYRLLNDASDVMPTDEEVANAVRVLAKVGFNPYAQNAINPAVYQAGVSPQLAQLAIMGQTPQTGTNYANVIPYLMSQGADATGNSKIDPRLLQSMMMNQMIPNFGFDNQNRNY